MGSRQQIKNESLGDLVKIYFTAKAEETAVKKTVEEYNKKIKQVMKDKNITEFTVDGIKASISMTDRFDFNELQAIEILREALTEQPELFEDVVRTKEYIDNDALESAIYNKNIDAGLLSACTAELPPTVTLRIGKEK